MRQITEIIIHCSATPEGRDYTVEDIDRWHRQRGFQMIGYHYVIYRDGSIHEGRPPDMVGAHCSGHNAHSIGVCYIGGLQPDNQISRSSGHQISRSSGHQISRSSDNRISYRGADTRTPEQKAALLKLLCELKIRYPTAHIIGHNAYANKACPCFDAESEYRNLEY